MLVKQLGGLLDEHWRHLSQAMGSPSGGRTRSVSFYNDEIVPLRISVVEITSQLEGIDARQAASTQAQIQNEFELLGMRLSRALSVGLGAALVLGVGCLVYIFPH